MTETQPKTGGASRRRPQKSADSASTSSTERVESSSAQKPERASVASKPKSKPIVPEDAMSADPADRPAERAEAVLDHAGERLGQFATAFGAGVRRSIARAKEEADDIWAEARDLRQRS